MQDRKGSDSGYLEPETWHPCTIINKALLLDGRPDDVAPFGPGAVVVEDDRIAE